MIKRIILLSASVACTSPDIEGIYPATPAATTVKFDFFHKPLPDIPLPNDIATRADASSATGLRLNASLLGPSQMEANLRTTIATMDGWGLMQAIAIPFTAPIDPMSIVAGHREANYDTSNDVIYLINIDRDSAEFGKLALVDLGQGNYPATIVKGAREAYGAIDPRAETLSILFEEADEDVNQNGILDPGEDTDADGVLDVPNYLPGRTPDAANISERADALMTFYEKETNTVLATPLVPLRERTTYAVVVTKRLRDAAGASVGSPFDWIHHAAQTEALRDLPDILPAGVTLDDVAFAFTYTTQTIQQDWLAVRDGLYGLGPQAHIAEEFPPTVDKVYPALDPGFYPGVPRHLLTGEIWQVGMRRIVETLMGEASDSKATTWLLDAVPYCDFIVNGSFIAPQLMPRRDAAGNWIRLDDQHWPADLDRVKAPAYPERIYFTLAVPRKEVSVRGQGKPAPTMIMLHGHGGNRYSAVMSDPGNFCKQGIAVLAIDGPTHGISLREEEEQLAFTLLGEIGLGRLADVIFSDRSEDFTGDGRGDTGADFWTSYMFHTRDMVRQFALDISSSTRMLRAFDGARTWSFDTDGDGQADLQGVAGDFDSDGVIDVGGDAPITSAGGSLGGMMAMLSASMEPHISATVPVVGGGALATIGPRSSNAGAKVGFIVRAMSQVYLGEPGAGGMVMRAYLPNGLRTAEVVVTTVPNAAPGDMLIAEDLLTHELGCGQVSPEGTVRAHVPTAFGNPHRLRLYAGPLVVGTECELPDGAVLKSEVASFDRDATFLGTTWPAGAPLVALAEGMGLRRANPELRRATAIGQMILDAGDPAVYARHLQREPLVFGTGEQTGAHALVITTVGDSSVPVAAGMTMARAAGILPYLETDARYGKPINQMLIDEHAAEGSSEIPRYYDNQGAPVVKDIANLSGGLDLYANLDVPRLDPPLRLGVDSLDALGGKTSVLYLMADPAGSHGFGEAGRMEDTAYATCVSECATPLDPGACGCNDVDDAVFDTGRYIWNIMGRYLATNGGELVLDACHESNSCPYVLPVPAPRQ